MRYLAKIMAVEPRESDAKLVLKNYDEWGKRVSDAYQSRPDFEAQYVSSWRALIPHIDKLFKQLQSKYEIEFVDEDPYKSYEDMEKEYTEGKLRIFTGFSKHPIFTEEQNWKFRAVHDALGHQAGFSKKSGKGFSFKDEVAVYNRHVKMIPPAGRLALFTEVVGQASVFINTGNFPTQKICKLHGFDYVNLGKIDEDEYQLNFSEAPKQKLAARSYLLKVLGEEVTDRYATFGLDYIPVFVYETLMNKKLRGVLLKREVEHHIDALPNFKEIALETNDGSDYHTIVSKGGWETKGQVLHLTRKEVDVLDEWESQYKRVPMYLKSGERTWVYVLKISKMKDFGKNTDVELSESDLVDMEWAIKNM